MATGDGGDEHERSLPDTERHVHNNNSNIPFGFIVGILGSRDNNGKMASLLGDLFVPRLACSEWRS